MAENVVPNTNRNKRKQKLETKTDSIDDEIEFDVECSGSSDENEVESEHSGDNAISQYEVELHEIKQEPVDEEFKSFDVRTRNRRKVSEIALSEDHKKLTSHFNIYDKYDQPRVKLELNLRTYERNKAELQTKKLVNKILKANLDMDDDEEKAAHYATSYEELNQNTKTLVNNIQTKRKSVTQPGFNLYREANIEMDDEEVNAAWFGLSFAELKHWANKELNLKKKKKDGNYSDFDTSLKNDLDLPTHFPDAAAEVKRLLKEMAIRLSEIRELRSAYGGEILKQAEQVNTLKEFQREFWRKLKLSGILAYIHKRKNLAFQYVFIRNRVFRKKLESPAMNMNEHNIARFEFALCHEQQQKLNEIDAFVYVKTENSTDIKIARIKDKFMNGKRYVGCVFSTPDPVELRYIYPIYKNNVIMVNDGKEFKFKKEDIVGRCIVLSFSDYITARPTDIPEHDVYFCTHIKTSKQRLIQPLVIEELTNVLLSYPGEIYYFQFEHPEHLIYDNQLILSPNEENDEIITGEPSPVQIKMEDDPEVSVKIENEEPVEEFFQQETETVVKVETPEEDETEVEVKVEALDDENNFISADPEVISDASNDDQPPEIILYDDTTNTINLADTENVLFVIDSSHVVNQNTLEDGEVIEID